MRIHGDHDWAEKARSAIEDSPAAAFAHAAAAPVRADGISGTGGAFGSHAAVPTPTMKSATGALAAVALPFAPKALLDRMRNRALYDGQRMLDLIWSPQEFAETYGQRFSIITRRAVWTMRQVLADEQAKAGEGCADLDLPPDDRRSPFTRDEVRDAFREVVWAASRINVGGMKHVDKHGEGFEAAVGYLAFCTHYAEAERRGLSPEKLAAFADACVVQFCRAFAQNPLIDRPAGWLNDHGRAVNAFFDAAARSAEATSRALPSALRAVAEAASKISAARLEDMHADARAWRPPYVGIPVADGVVGAASESLKHSLDANLIEEAAAVRERLVAAMAPGLERRHAEVMLSMAARELDRCRARGNGPCPASEEDVAFARGVAETMPGLCLRVLKADAGTLAALTEAPSIRPAGEHARALAEIAALSGAAATEVQRTSLSSVDVYGLAKRVAPTSPLASWAMEDARVRLAVKAWSAGGSVLAHPCGDALLGDLEGEAARLSAGGRPRPGVDSRSVTRAAETLRLAATGPRGTLDDPDAPIPVGPDGLPEFKVLRSRYKV